MQNLTFVEKIFWAKSGSIVFKKPDIVLTHDNTASIRKTFEKMGGEKVYNPNQLMVVLDHNAPPTNAKLATDYQAVRELVKEQNVKKFYDSGSGICHQIMSYHAKPGMLIVGSDSHTCTAGAFNAMAVGIDRTEAAGLWKRGETWFRVPESIKITLNGKLPEGVYAKDLSLWIIGMIGSAGANYMSIEYHGSAVKHLSVAERMTLANLASEMGAKNAVFPPDEILENYYGEKIKGVWADPGAEYFKEYLINLDDLLPLVAAPHHVDNVKTVSDVSEIQVQQALIGTCTNGRLEDLRIAADILKGKKVSDGFQLMIAPASKEIYLEAIDEGIISSLLKSGAILLGTSCGPCLGTGQGIPADGTTVVSTANRNFLGRMGNKNVEIYLASPATVAHSALIGKITDPRDKKQQRGSYPYRKLHTHVNLIARDENRKTAGVWDYSDINHLNTDQMFAGNLTYEVLSSDAEGIRPHLFKGFDDNFADKLREGDIIVAGENFGCGSSREHPAVGLAYAGVQAVIVKSVNRIFYRSAINQGLLLIVNREIVEAYQKGDKIEIDFNSGTLMVDEKQFEIPVLPDKLRQIIKSKGLVNWIRSES